MDWRSFRIAVLVGVLFTAAPGCGGKNPVKPAPMGTSRIRGQFEGGLGTASPGGLRPAHIDTADVNVARIRSDGTLAAIVTPPSLTNNRGFYVVQTPLNGEAGLVVLGNKGSISMRVVVSGPVLFDTTVVAAPMTNETTVEASIWQRLIATGRSDRVTLADVCPYITRRIAVTLGDIPTGADEMATVLEAEVDAHRAVLTDRSFGVSASQFTRIHDGRIQARIALERALDAVSENSLGTRAAYDDFNAAEVVVYEAAGVTRSQYARARETSAQALVRASAGLRDDVVFFLQRSANDYRARTLMLSVMGAFDSLGATAQLKSALTTAAATLRETLESAATADDMAGAFRTYHNAVLQRLKVLVPDQATAIDAADAALNAPGHAHAALLDALAAANGPTAVVDAYLAYYGEATTSVETALGGAGPTMAPLLGAVIVDVSTPI